MRADEILELLQGKYKRHKPGDVILLPEARLSTGYGGRREQRIDLWVMMTAPSARFHRTAYEIKVNRQDFLRETKDPLKRRGAKMLANQFYFVSPEGIIRKDEVPTDCGLIVARDGKLKTLVDAPDLETYPPTWGFVASAVRQVRRQSR